MYVLQTIQAYVYIPQNKADHLIQIQNIEVGNYLKFLNPID